MKEMYEQIKGGCGLFDPVRCVKKLADPWCKVVVEFLVSVNLSEYGDGVGCSEFCVWWCLRDGVGVAVIFEIPPCVVHFGEDDLATVKGLQLVVSWVWQVGVGDVLVCEVVSGCFVVGVPSDIWVLWVFKDSVDDVRVVVIKLTRCEARVVR